MPGAIGLSILPLLRESLGVDVLCVCPFYCFISTAERNSRGRHFPLNAVNRLTLSPETHSSCATDIICFSIFENYWLVGGDKSHCSEDPSRRALSKGLSLSAAPFSSFFTVYLHLEYQAQNISEENNSILVNKQIYLIAGRTPPLPTTDANFFYIKKDSQLLEIRYFRNNMLTVLYIIRDV